MPANIPKALPFHKKLADFLQNEERELWEWFSGDAFTQGAFDEQRLYLLKNTYRLEREKHAALYEQAESVAHALHLSAPVTLYQMMDGQQRNAGLVFQPGQIHITFSGDMLTAFTGAEMQFALGHEMAHYIHQTSDKGRFQTADRLLDWICGENGASASYGHSFRLTRLYQEIYSDRIGYFCCNDVKAAISTLVRLSSGLSEVSVQAYLAQADEVVSQSQAEGSEGISHPETFIRALALADWASGDLNADDKLKSLVEGNPKLEALDVLSQAKLSKTTADFIAAFINRPWQNTETLEAHAQGYFYEFKLNSESQASELLMQSLKGALEALPKDMQEYFGFVLLDFVTVDPDLEDAPLIESLRFAKSVGLTESYDGLVAKELKFTKKQMASLRKAAEMKAS